MHVSNTGHALNLAGLQELKSKNISGVHMPYFADWYEKSIKLCNFAIILILQQLSARIS